MIIFQLLNCHKILWLPFKLLVQYRHVPPLCIFMIIVSRYVRRSTTYLCLGSIMVMAQNNLHIIVVVFYSTAFGQNFWEQK